MTNSNSALRMRSAAMRLVLAFGAILTLGILDAATPVAAQGAWCAQYSGKGGGSTNCGFYTLQQCQWAVSGVGGFCSPSPYAVYSDQPSVRRKVPRQYR